MHHANTGGKLIAASKVNSTNVYDTAGEKVGSIYDVMIDKSTGKAEYTIMSFGGFLGMGANYHPLPWRTLTYDASKGGYVVNIDKQRLEEPQYIPIAARTCGLIPTTGGRWMPSIAGS